MLNRRDFLKTAVIGTAAFGAGLKLDEVGRKTGGPRVVLHGFVPADETAIRDVLGAFLALAGERLPAPAVDAPAAWRPAVAGALRAGADRYERGGDRVFSVQLGALDQPLPADVLLQQGSLVLDPARGFDRGLLGLRERLRGREARIAVSCRLEPRPGALALDRVLVGETERGGQARLALHGARRRLDLAGPTGRLTVAVDDGGVRVVESSCRHATCRRQGAIARPGELIACAPNRVVLRIETA